MRRAATRRVPEYRVADAHAKCFEVCGAPDANTHSRKVEFVPGGTVSPVALPHLTIDVGAMFA